VAATVRTGVSGWNYAGWRGDFYPRGLPHRLELEHVSGLMGAVEVNGSFYSLQRPSSYRSWAARVPEDHLLAVKGSRFITHMKKLRGVDEALATFFSSGPLLLGPHLGPFLWQLPARAVFSPEVLADFFSRLPRTAAQAARVARQETGRVRTRFGEDPWRRAAAGTAGQRLRHAVEVRHESFRSADFFALCREHDVAVVVSDGAGRWPVLDEVTSDHVYVRLHGGEELYTSGYGPEALDAWAARVRAWSEHPDVEQVLVFFDNDVKVRAPYDAIALADRLGLVAGSGRVGAPDEPAAAARPAG
jgi:uncharacterized protein YecE (DUF72 family)